MSPSEKKNGTPPPETEPPTQSSATALGNALLSDGFLTDKLAATNDAPPAYGELPDQIEFSQPGIEAGAAVTRMC
jgi:hypothetical protein